MPAVLEPPADKVTFDDAAAPGGGGPPPDDWDRGGRGGGGGDDDGDDEEDDDFSAPGRGWVTLATFWHPAEAHIARLRLESAGVACVLLDELTAATNVFAIAVGGVKLQVPRAQSAQAARLLRDARLPRPASREADAPDAPLAVARFGRLIDAKAAACVVEAAGFSAEVVPGGPTPPIAGWLPARVAAAIWPAAEVRVRPADLAAAARSLRATPFAVGLTFAARRRSDKPRHDVP